MVLENKAVPVNAPLWTRSAEKFEDAHKGVVQFSLWRLQQAGQTLSLTQFVAHYVGSLPENLPPAVLLDVTKWAIEGWETWQAAKKEQVLA